MRAIVTVIGRDRVGIIAGVCVLLAERGVNILDISQTVLGGNLTMAMLVDLSGSPLSFSELKEALEKAGNETKMTIRIQREDIFEVMDNV
ncbi:MAG: ACT domain-containing protein [Oscillospiraceae bacterium]|jgi:ACT domain-containing protein|nr:ACT domain-containing protein [Oscillospiraceae bacterium]